ncbi:HEAT repeat domain-containing protein [candidate division KSB1 bacterium]|nr:HEAT repeat domain-containing protein [candidate division KSB1 bacterium]
MKLYKYLIIVVSVLSLHCSHSTEPETDILTNDIKIELLRQIFRLDVGIDWSNEKFNYYRVTNEELPFWSTEAELRDILREDDIDIRLLRVGTLLLYEHTSPDANVLLLDFLNNHRDDLVRFNAARALAYRDNKAGIDLLNECASGQLTMTSSGFEVNAAALALLILGEELPEEYYELHIADPLFMRL